MLDVHVDSLLDLVHEIYTQVGTSRHDTALSGGHCFGKLSLMIVHECIIDDDEEGFAKGDSLRYSSCACMGNDNVCCRDVGGEVGSKGEGGYTRVGSGRLWGWRAMEGGVTVLNGKGSYAKNGEGMKSIGVGNVIREGGELGCTHGDEKGERHGLCVGGECRMARAILAERGRGRALIREHCWRLHVKATMKLRIILVVIQRRVFPALKFLTCFVVMPSTCVMPFILIFLLSPVSPASFPCLFPCAPPPLPLIFSSPNMPSHCETPLPQSTPQESSISLQKSPTRSALADYDAFSALTEVKPGTIPLLVQMPDGNRSQIHVPFNSTVDQISSMLRESPGNDLRLSFGNEDLPPDATLLDTNIVDAYEHAGNLLQVIGNAGGDADAKAAALDSACAVVERVSNGIKDMETLCAAAMTPSPFPEALMPSSPRTEGIVAAGAEEAERDTPKELDDGEFKMLNSLLSQPMGGGRTDKDFVDAPEKATPSALVHGLSRRLPLLFPHSAAVATVGEEEQEKEQEKGVEEEQPGLNRRKPSLGVQPSISSIRAARRMARANLSSKSVDMEDSYAAAAITIGHSTNGMSLPPDLPERSAYQGESSKGEGSVWMASNAKSTWLEDVMKTWEVGVVRQSGVLEKTKDGQELNDYLNSLEEEAQMEAEIDAIERQSLHNGHNNQTQGATQLGPQAGESEDDEGEDGADNVIRKDGIQSIDGSQMKDNEHDTKNRISGVDKSIVSQDIDSSSATQQGKGSVMQMRHAHSAPEEHLKGEWTNTSADSSQRTMFGLTVQEARSTSSPSTSSASTKQTKTPNLNCTSSSSTPPKIMRQPTKIAPAPNVSVSGLPEGLVPNVMFPGGMAPQCMTWPLPTTPSTVPPTAPPRPKKRGRKRKNPELTDEERALVRKEKNKESAKLSRVRRKVIAEEYEGRLKALVGENASLRKQVEGLNNRLVYMQSLLTVSVRPEPAPSTEQR